MAWRLSTRSSRLPKSTSWRNRGSSRRNISGETRWQPTSGSSATRRNRQSDCVFHAADRIGSLRLRLVDADCVDISLARRKLAGEDDPLPFGRDGGVWL